MSDITINYKGSAIATMDASGTKTLLTEGMYCEDDIEVVYVKPAGGDDTFLSVGSVGSISVAPVLGGSFSSANTRQRRSFWQKSGDHMVAAIFNSTTYSTSSPYYPHKVPSGATKAIFTASGEGNFGMRAWTWDSANNSYADTGFDSGWLNMPASQAVVNLPSGAEYVTVNFRANSSNSNYTASQEPYNVSLSFE